ncbi:MAG TPA: YccF domain-containing protein [Candidatus Ozemobacteraceae bacterium]|nr:YccF domain-containing protein [Candidatus Ozemobacteraceae bacterium]
MDSCLFLILRLVWFIFIGLPVGLICINVGWLCMLTVIGIPLGLWIFNRIPMIMTLQPDLEDRYRLELAENEVFLGRAEQCPLILRLLWLILVGWWLSLIWINIAYLLTVTVIGLPFGFWMFNRLPWVIFLTRI